MRGLTQNPPRRSRTGTLAGVLIGIFCALLGSGVAHAQAPVAGDPVLPPTEVGAVIYLGENSADAIYVLEDLNSDGNCNGPGEARIYYDDSSPEIDINVVRHLAIDPAGDLYVGDSSVDVILRLRDIDGDGTANQAGEATIYFDENSYSGGFASISNMAFDADGFLFLTDTGTAGTTERYVLRIRDENGDGYCSEMDGEVLVIYQLSTTAGETFERPSGLAIDTDGTLFISDFDSDRIYRLTDSSSPLDGDANDIAEQFVVFDTATSTAATLDFAENIALGYEENGVRPLYANAGPTEDIIYAFRDDDADGDFLGVTEVSAFWDTTQADGVVPANIRTIAVAPENRMFVIEAGATGVNDALMLLRDANSDGDANDSGEVTVYFDATNAGGLPLTNPQGLVIVRSTPMPPQDTFVRGDANGDGAFVGLTDALFLLNFQFTGGAAPGCFKAADLNDDGEVSGLLDSLYALNFQFNGGPAPELPFPDCGPDPTSDSLTCDTPLVCP